MVSPTGEVQRVSDKLLQRIVADAYPQGLRLPAESALAEEFSCGRSTIREALRHLADMGLIRSRRGSGAMVLDYRREGTPALLPTYLRLGRIENGEVMARELLRLRMVMATEAARLAAIYAEPAALDEARRHLELAPGLESDPGAHALNELDFYRALVAASGIWPATWVVNALWAPLREINAELAPALGRVPANFQATMENLLGRIEASDEAGSVAVVRAWFTRIDAEQLRRITELLPEGS